MERVLRDLDNGFWRFCTSYNNRFWLNGYKKGSHDLCQYVGSKLKDDRSSVDITPCYSFRPAVPPRRRHAPGPGAIYDLTFMDTNRPRRYFNYSELLLSTRGSHKNVLHIIMDSMQHTVRVTLPAVLPMDVLKATVDDFLKGCAYALTPSPSTELQVRPRRGKHKTLREMEEQGRIFEQFRAEWPHYVLPPSHPFAFLDSSMPCDFFSTGPCIF